MFLSTALVEGRPGTSLTIALCAKTSSIKRATQKGEGDADAVIEKRGLKQISDAGALIGRAMKATKGQANPAQLNEILKRKLAG